MDIVVRTLIDYKDHGMQTDDLEIIQEVFAPTECRLKLSFGSKKKTIDHASLASDWLGAELHVKIFDREHEDEIAKEYIGKIAAVHVFEEYVFLQAWSLDTLMKGLRRDRAFANMTAQDIATEVISGAGIGGHEIFPVKSSMKFRYMQQYDETDYDFLRRIAWYDGAVFFDTGNVFVYAPSLPGSDPISLGSEEVSDVHIVTQFRGRLHSRGVPYDYLKHAEPKENEEIGGKLSGFDHPVLSKSYDKVFEGSEGGQDINHLSSVPKEHFQKYLTTRQKSRASGIFFVNGTTLNPMVSVGTAIRCTENRFLHNPVAVYKLHARFTGHVYSAEFFASEAKGAAYSAEVPAPSAGPQPAEVIDNKDPEKLGRVQVRFLWDVSGRALPWARVVQAGAGMDGKGIKYGTHFTPRVGDQVFVTFENGDPSFPVVIGSVYHSEKKPRFKTENGTEEMLVASTPGRSSIRIIDTKDAEKIVISMRDKKNIVTMDLAKPSITIESKEGDIVIKAKNISITADEEFSVKAKTCTMKFEDNASLSAQQGISLSAGSNVKLEASASVNIEAPTIESKADATNVIQGGIVRIN